MLRRESSINRVATPTGATNMARLFRGALILTILLANAPIASALEGCENVDTVIGGKHYSIPMANKDYKTDFFLFKKALAGDKDAYDMILGQNKVKWFYIGDFQPLWAKITRYNVVVVDPNDPNDKEKLYG